MEGNPYFKMVSLFRADSVAHTPTYFRLGTVVSANPLQIDVAGILQNKSSLKKDKGLDFSLGDEVLLVTLDDDQTFIIIAKVVDA